MAYITLCKQANKDKLMYIQHIIFKIVVVEYEDIIGWI